MTHRERHIAPEFRGAGLKLFHDCDRGETILSGPAGTGKTVAVCHYLNAVLNQYPGARVLMCRKTLTSLTTGALVTYQEQILDPAFRVMFFGGSSREPASFKYPNGSRLVIGGLDRASKVLSSEYDIIYVNEATEATLTDWETLSTRLRANEVPYQRIIGDTNPDSPTHWIMQRAQEGKLQLLYSVHEDNPAYWDAERQEWTPKGAVYIARLENLTGVRYKRLRNGLWVAAEGQVYEEWDPAVHLIDRADLPTGWQGWPRFWAVDFGYRDPFVWGEFGVGPDDWLVLLQQIYRTGRLVQDHAADILTATQGHPRPAAIICDHDAEGRATLERHLRMKTQPAYKAISDGIQAVQQRLRREETGTGVRRPGLVIVRDGLIHNADETLVERKAPTSTADEFGGYVWNEGGGRRRGEEPVDKDNHGMDMIRYAVAHHDKIGKTRKTLRLL